MLWVMVIFFVLFLCDVIRWQHSLHIDSMVCHCPSVSVCVGDERARHGADESLAKKTTMMRTDIVSSTPCSFVLQQLPLSSASTDRRHRRKASLDLILSFGCSTSRKRTDVFSVYLRRRSLIFRQQDACDD